ncbi:MAG: hemerythrin domain-containing protein [Paludibacter sp.]|nr:hemerythrin domain-containing protein [Paludibacter sp.]
MRPTENLKSEHKDINELLKIMSKIAASIKSNEVFYTNDVEDIIDFLKYFIDKSHHGKEEIFYPALQQAGIQKDIESLNEMLYEHTLARTYLKDIYSCVENCKNGFSFSGEMLADSLNNYVFLISNHIQKEEDIIFPMAERELSNEKQIEITNKFEKIEENIVQHGFHEHYHDLLKKLQTKYPD